MGAFVSLIVTREDLQGTVTRFPGMTYQAREDGTISNLYQITLINKTFEPQKVELKSLASGMKIEIVGEQKWVLEPQSKFEGRFFLVRSQEDIQVSQEKVKLILLNRDEEIDQIKTNFTAPLRK
jgi:hypothetical protein